jgi:mediator of RNA polymerase II transcription subunit 13, fungi type
MSLSSPALRQVFSAVKRAQKTYSEAQILFQFLPSSLLYATDYSSTSASDMLAFTCSVYDRILRPADRDMSRRFFEHSVRIRSFCQEPAFALAPPAHTRVQLVRQYPPLSLEVTERHAFLHVSYRIYGRWLLAACTDQRGEGHNLGVWMIQSESPEAYIASTVWNAAFAFAQKADIEWRVVIAKLGLLNGLEIDGTSIYLPLLSKH